MLTYGQAKRRPPKAWNYSVLFGFLLTKKDDKSEEEFRGTIGCKHTHSQLCSPILNGFGNFLRRLAFELASTFLYGLKGRFNIFKKNLNAANLEMIGFRIYVVKNFSSKRPNVTGKLPIRQLVCD
jgi:hypothetical protein